MTDMRVTEDQMVGLVRNALLVAGHEMGATGDHWPVIKSTIYSVMKDWEELKIERNVFNELRTHAYQQLNEMDQILLTCSEETQAETGPQLQVLREIYDAYFSAVDMRNVSIEDDEIPAHVQRAKNIIKSLED